MRKRSLNQRANIIIALIVTVIVIGGWGLTLARRIGTVNPHIKIERGREDELLARAKEVEIKAISQMMTGEVAVTADRLRGACALALAASIVSVSDKPANTATLLQKIIDKTLLPPGMTRTGERQVETDLDVMSVRSQLSPLKIEVVSIAKEQRFGPGLVVRLAADLFEGQGAQLWVSNTLDRVVLPPPFAPEQELSALGWRQEQFAAAQRENGK